MYNVEVENIVYEANFIQCASCHCDGFWYDINTFSLSLDQGLYMVGENAD